MATHDFVPAVLWMHQEPEVRRQIAEDFGITRTGYTEVQDDRVVKDGFTDEDLRALTSETMAAYVGSEDSFLRLWELTCAKAYSIVNPPMGTIRTEEEPATIPESEPVKKAKTKKHEG